MSESSPPSNAALSVEESLSTFLTKAAEGIRQRHHRCEGRIRRAPTGAMLIALAGGYLLHRIPLRAVVITVCRLLWALTPTALVLFAVVKLVALLQKPKSTQQRLRLTP